MSADDRNARAARKFIRALEALADGMSTEAMLRTARGLALGPAQWPRMGLAGWLADRAAERADFEQVLPLVHPQEEEEEKVQVSDGDQWYSWSGGSEGPATPDHFVQVRMRDDWEGQSRCHLLRWQHRNVPTDIVGWRYPPGVWQRWDSAGNGRGGLPPKGLPGSMRVEVRLRSGDLFIAKAGHVHWETGRGQGGEVMEWRPVE